MTTAHNKVFCAIGATGNTWQQNLLLRLLLTSASKTTERKLFYKLAVVASGGNKTIPTAQSPNVASNFKLTPRFHINILTTTFCLTTAFTSFGQSQTKKVDQVGNNKTAQVDTSKTAIIAFDKKGNYPFDNTFNPASLTQNDIYNIDSLLIACVTDYNNSLDKDHKEWSIDLKKNNYRKQLIVVTNKKGEKEVWVNCFCHTWDNNNWKTNILFVDDGGNCYFNFKINLATKKFYDLGVNGVA